MIAVTILIPAAGAARRMRGRDKLLEPVDGVPLLRRQAARALGTDARVIVLVPDAAHPRAKALAGLSVDIVPVAGAAEGMGRTLATGAAALADDTLAALILPADMPDLTSGDLVAVIEAFAETAAPVQATACDGTPGHPVLFPADCFAALKELTGDTGARAVLHAQDHRLQRIALPGRHALTDLDTPEDWAAWRATTAAPRE